MHHSLVNFKFPYVIFLLIHYQDYCFCVILPHLSPSPPHLPNNHNSDHHHNNNNNVTITTAATTGVRLHTDSEDVMETPVLPQ